MSILWVLAWCSWYAWELLGCVKLDKFGWYTAGYFTFVTFFSQCKKTTVLHRRAPSCPPFSTLITEETGEGTHASTEEHTWRLLYWFSHRENFFSAELNVRHLGKSVTKSLAVFLERGSSLRDGLVNSYMLVLYFQRILLMSVISF